jgi:hypothetical protein
MLHIISLNCIDKFALTEIIYHVRMVDNLMDANEIAKSMNKAYSVLATILPDKEHDLSGGINSHDILHACVLMAGKGTTREIDEFSDWLSETQKGSYCDELEWGNNRWYAMARRIFAEELEKQYPNWRDLYFK